MHVIRFRCLFMGIERAGTMHRQRARRNDSTHSEDPKACGTVQMVLERSQPSTSSLVA
jgi:hypothetical protein